MAFKTYTDLKTALASWLARSDLTSYLDDFITLGEDRLARELRIWQIETALSVVMSGGSATVPSDFLELKHARISGSPTYPLDIKDAWWIFREYPTRSSDAKPHFIAVDAGEFVFGPYPDSNYTVVGTYYKKPATCVGGTTNEWTDYAGDALLFAALAETAPFLKDDPRIVVWEGKLQGIIEGYQGQEKHKARRNARIVHG